MTTDTSFRDCLPIASVIMPTYNQAGFIGKAIESVLLQTERNLELIIVDNFSGDGTKDVVLSYCDSRIQYFNFKNNGVIAASRNFGIRKAKGQYIAFLDSDDYWDPKKLEHQLIHFRDVRVIAVACRATVFGEEVYYRVQGNYNAKAEFTDAGYREILNDNQVITSSIVVRAAALTRTNGFNENPDFVCFEDWDLWLQLAKIGKIRILAQKLVHYFVSRRRAESYCLITENMTKLIAKERDAGFLPEVNYREPANRVFLKIARSYIELDAKRSREYYWRVLRGSSSINCQLKGLCGLIICCIPSALRGKVLFGLYQIEHVLNNGQR